MRHSAAHVMAHAVKRLFPQAKLGIGPTIENGFYYDIYIDHAFTPEDLRKIEKEMREIITQDNPFKRIEMNREEAISFLKERGEFLKVEIVESLPNEKVSFYEEGDFVDLCRGPHVKSTGEIKAFALLSTSSAYWRGDENRELLQRIYGTAFPSRKELEAHLARLEEAKKRDHRLLGKHLSLFTFFEEAGPGLVFWLPKGAMLRRLLEDEWLRVHQRAGYHLVYTPHIAKAGLWEKSGHLKFFEQNMFSRMTMEGQDYLLKPMNCPFHILIYRQKRRSYRELPLRLCEFGTVYRYERTGVLHGLLRVRGLTIDDAHIFCSREQIKGEIVGCLHLMQAMLRKVQMEDIEVELSTMPEKHAGDVKEWEEAQEQLKQALRKCHLPFAVDEGGGAFYGPKIDVKIRDSLGRKWQGPTIQLDFNLPRRFELTYVAESGKQEPVYMVHRAMFGSMERFLGMLIEHFGGQFPLWLSPEQIRICPVSDKTLHYAHRIGNALNNEGFRVSVDDSNNTLGYKIRQAELEKVPLVVVVGRKEVVESSITVREKGGKQTKTTLESWVKELKQQMAREMETDV